MKSLSRLVEGVNKRMYMDVLKTKTEDRNGIHF